MKKKNVLLTVAFAVLLVVNGHAQTKIGFIHYDSLVMAMPEYQQVQDEMQRLRQQYEAEAEYNESTFKRQFAEFLQGQKDFSANILLKRQRDLQNAMERGLAYREQADSLLRQAEMELSAPLYRKLDAAIREVGIERGYGYIANMDARSLPFIHPDIAEDAEPFVREKLMQK